MGCRSAVSSQSLSEILSLCRPANTEQTVRPGDLRALSAIEQLVGASGLVADEPGGVQSR